MIGYYTDSSVICYDCRVINYAGTDIKFQVATEESLPDGFTCDECGGLVR